MSETALGSLTIADGWVVEVLWGLKACVAPFYLPPSFSLSVYLPGGQCHQLTVSACWVWIRPLMIRVQRKTVLIAQLCFTFVGWFLIFKGLSHKKNVPYVAGGMIELFPFFRWKKGIRLTCPGSQNWWEGNDYNWCLVNSYYGPCLVSDAASLKSQIAALLSPSVWPLHLTLT